MLAHNPYPIHQEVVAIPDFSFRLVQCADSDWRDVGAVAIPDFSSRLVQLELRTHEGGEDSKLLVEDFTSYYVKYIRGSGL
jgi:hypothetical protein